MLNFMLQILGTIFLVIVPSAFFIWRHLASQIASKVLSFNVTRKSPRERTTAELQGFIREVPFLKYMEVDQDYARSRYPDTPMMSLGEYMGSLHAQGEVSMQRALVSIMDRFGLRVALPLALFAPPSWRRDGLDSLAGVSKRFPLASVVLANGISSLGLFAVSAISQRSNVDMLSVRHGETSDFGSFPTNEAVEDEKGETSGEQKHKKQYAITIMARGSRDDEMCDAIPNPFSLGFDFRDFSVTRKASIEAPKQRDIRKLATAVPIHPLFPDLCFGNGGLPSLCSDAQATKNTAIAVVCNRLMTNSLIGRFESPEIPSEPFAARLTAWSDDRSQLRTHDSARMGGEAGSNVAGGSMQTPRENGEVTSLEDFVEALEKHGHTVRMHIASCTTSFGIGLSVRQEESNGGGDHCSYTQIPLAYPIETGLFAKDERGKDAKTTTLMAHASIYLDIDGPFVTAQLEWCLSIAGFTGWLPRNTVARPWQLTPGSLNFHSEDAFKTIQDRRKALRLITASSVASNAAASKGKLLFGGYGTSSQILMGRWWVKKEFTDRLTAEIVDYCVNTAALVECRR